MSQKKLNSTCHCFSFCFFELWMQLENMQYLIKQAANSMWINTYSSFNCSSLNQKCMVAHCMTYMILGHFKEVPHRYLRSVLSNWACTCQRKTQRFPSLFNETPCGLAVVSEAETASSFWSSQSAAANHTVQWATRSQTERDTQLEVNMWDPLIEQPCQLLSQHWIWGWI